MRVLIGHTGFVGSNLRSGGSFDVLINSKNSEDLRGLEASEVICAGVSAVKWKANQEPERDRAEIDRLIDNLRCVRTRHFTLISTVDVYPKPLEIDETSPISDGINYGGNRGRLECFVADTFENHTIIRLPALFGPGLKKNIIFDLCHDNMVASIDLESAFQWYDVSRLTSDIEAIVRSEIPIVNIACEPIKTREICTRFFPDKCALMKSGSDSPRYDMRTRYPELLGGTRMYHYGSEQVLQDLEHYLRGGQWI